jgi:HAE1 family hydrophobic/amphiphilic exporter-1
MSLLARLSLANRGLVALIAVVIAGFGIVAVPALKQQLLPSLQFPAAFIVATYPGASPEIVEQRVAAPVETSIQGIPGLTKVSSTSREGSATVQVEYEFGTDLDAAVNKMQTALNRLQPQLPAGVEPTVLAGSTDDLPAIVLAAAQTGDQQQLAERLRSTVVPELQGIPGVRSVTVSGAEDPVVVITPNPARMAQTRVDLTAVGTAVQSAGVSTPAGTITADDQSFPVQVGTPIDGVEALREVRVPGVPGAPPVRLGDFATVESQPAPATSFTRTNGAPSLGIEVTATPDGNAVQISREIRDRLDELAASADTDLTVIFDQGPYVEKSIGSLASEGLLGLAMAVLVILVFLLSVRSTLVTAVSIPLSVLVALIALYVGDYSLNLLTLGALTIAVGRVVDDSIVVLENIKRHLGYGENKRVAIITGVREVAGAVTASTLTTVAVFAPIALVGGFVGQLFAPFAITVTVALLASLLVALTVIPVLAYWFLRPAGGGTDEGAVRATAEEKERRSPLQRAYVPLVAWTTRSRTHRWVTVGVSLLVLLGTFALSTALKTNFLDDSGGTSLSLRQELPVGTSLAATDAAAKQVEDVLARTDGVESYQVTAGGTGMPWEGGGGNRTASYSLSLREGTDVEALKDRLRTDFDGLSGAGEITVGGGGQASADQLAVVVQAAEDDALAAATEQVRAAMAGTPDVSDVTSSLAERTPRIDVRVDPRAAAAAGLTEAGVTRVVAQAFRGSPLGRVTVGGRQRDVVMRLGRVAPTTVDELRALPLGPVRRTGPITLGSVADVDDKAAGPQEVTRIDGDRSVTVTGTATGGNLGATTRSLTDRLAALTLPAGASYEIGGVSAEQADAFAKLGIAVLAAIAIVFVIMVATFRSLLQPLILLVSIPFAATGAIALLLATGTPLGVPALIGVLMLVGIVVTNAIVLMDLINQYRSRGTSVADAVVEGGRRRLRPILMTAIATIFALLPMALGLTGEGGFISQPLAIVVIGGLLSSTLLTLVLVPTLYTMVEATKERMGARFRRPAPPHGAATVEEPYLPVDVTNAARRPAPSAALVDGTDQFEVLRLPRTPRSRPEGE